MVLNKGKMTSHRKDGRSFTLFSLEQNTFDLLSILSNPKRSLDKE